MPSDLRRFFRRAVTVLRWDKHEADLSREITAHLQMLEDQFVETGMTRDDARYAARRAFGGVEQTKELHRDERSLRWLRGWPMDLKLGARMLVKSPGLTVIAVTALAVAIGAGSAYLEFTRDLLSPTLGVPGGERIVGIRVWDAEQRTAQTRVLADFAAWRGNVTALEHLGASSRLDRHLITGDGRTDAARAVDITASAFALIPAAPLLGRTLYDEDELPGAAPVAVIGHDLWRSRFNSDPNVIGRTVWLGPVAHTIVGVMPDGFAFPGNENLWTPLKVQAAGLTRGEGPAIRMFGRLKEGASIEAAQAQLQGLLAADGRQRTSPLQADVRPYLESLMSADASDPALLAVVHGANLVFVMLLGICGANVATLVFARTAMREAEITVRTALGASRGRICAQLFAEALVLSSVAALVGVALALFGGRWVTRMFGDALGQPVPFWWDESLSPETPLYAAALAVFAALIVGVIPALKATGAHLQGRLREAGAAGSTMKFGGLWTTVIVAQAAMTVMFLAAVVSLGWTNFRGQYSLDVTYPRDQILTARLESDDSGRGTEARRPVSADALQAVVARLKTEPGVVSATYATSLPGTTFEQFLLEFATPEVTAGAKFATTVPWSESAQVGAGFFETIGIPLVAGRLFTDAESLGGHNVAVVDETFVRVILGGRSPLGLMVRQPPAQPGQAPGPWHEIVGVVRDVTLRLRKGPDDAVLYRPAGSVPAGTLRLLVRTQGSAAAMSQRLQAAALSASSDVRIVDAKSMDQVAEAETLPMRFFLRIFAVVSAIALLLSTAGIYALVSFTLARRTREIGIRIALGAAPNRIISGVFSRAFTQVGLGVLAGSVPSVVIIVSGVEDSGGMGPWTGVGITLAVSTFVVLVAMVPCAAPLRRALRIEPTQALRADG